MLKSAKQFVVNLRHTFFDCGNFLKLTLRTLFLHLVSLFVLMYTLDYALFPDLNIVSTHRQFKRKRIVPRVISHIRKYPTVPYLAWKSHLNSNKRLSPFCYTFPKLSRSPSFSVRYLKDRSHFNAKQTARNGYKCTRKCVH